MDLALNASSAGSERTSRVVWALAWPAVALNSLQVFNMLLDRYYVGHLPDAALTAQGASLNVMFLMFTLAVATATGVTAIVSRAYGAELPGEVRRAAREGLSLAIVLSLAVAALTVVLALTLAPDILPASDHAARAMMSRFLAVYALSLPSSFVIQALAGALRGVGDTRSSMSISGLQILLHMGLNSILVPSRLGPFHTAGWGLAGTGAALAISGSLCALIYIAWARKTPLGSVWAWRLPALDWAKRILRVAYPAAAMGALRIASLTVFTVVVALVPNGSLAIAALSVALAIESIMIMPGFGLAAAAGALVGQSLGMGRPDRAERLGWAAGLHGAVLTGVLATGVFFAAAPLSALLLGDKPDLIAVSATLLRYLAFTEVGFSYAMILFGAMQGAGDSALPMWISLVSLWFIRVPLAFVLALRTHQPLCHLGGIGIGLPLGFGLGATGGWLAMSATQALQGILAHFAFATGRWKLRSV